MKKIVRYALIISLTLAVTLIPFISILLKKDNSLLIKAYEVVRYGSEKNALREKIENGKSVDTNIHKFTIKKYDKTRFRQIAIVHESQDTITLLGILDQKNYSETNLLKEEIYEIQYNLKDNSISKKKILTLSPRYRVNDLVSLTPNKAIISFVAAANKDSVFFGVSELDIQLGKETIIYKSTPIEPPHFILQSGGGLALDKKGNLLIALGDFRRHDVPDFDSSELGKIISLNLSSKKISIYARGFRNPQGLFWSRQLNSLFEVEHGPSGGDELNQIRKAGHYGWPKVTYGTPYGYDTSILNAESNGQHYGNHKGYINPLFTFIPKDIGIKSLAQMPKDASEFPYWNNDFFICSSNGLFRTRVLKENSSYKIVFMENLLNGCRDLAISSSGIIFTTNLYVLRRLSN